MAVPGLFTSKDKPVAVGVLGAQPASGSLYLDARYSDPGFPFVLLRFRFDAFRITVTDAAGSGSSGSAKIFDFNEGLIHTLGSRHSFTAFAEGSALTTGAGDAAFVIAFGSVAANAGDGALTGTEVDFGAATGTLTNSGGTTTGPTVMTSIQTPLDGTGTAVDLYINWSGSAATIDATSTFDISGTFDWWGVVGTSQNIDD
jgi:hypothetical protein